MVNAYPANPSPSVLTNALPKEDSVSDRAPLHQTMRLARARLEEVSSHQIDRLQQLTGSQFNRRYYLSTSPQQFWWLKSGVVRTLTYQDDGNIITLGLWGPGDLVGTSLSRVSPYLVEAITNVEAVSITEADWQLPPELLSRYWQQTEILLLARANRRADVALLEVLQWLAHRFGLQVEQGALINLRITHQDLADLSGLSRVTVTRLLSQLEDQQLIHRKSRQLIVAETGEHWHYDI